MHPVSTIDFVIGIAVYYVLFLYIISLVLLRVADLVNDRFIVVAAGIVLFFIAALRAPGIDRDSISYILSFEQFKGPLDYFIHNSDWFYYEPSYYLIPSSAKLFFGKAVYPSVVFAVFALIAIPIKLSGIKRLSSFVGLSLVLFYCNYFLLQEMTQIRAAIACGLLLWAIYYHHKKDYYAFALICVIGFMIHYSALLIPVILLLNTTSFSVKRYVIIGFAGIAIAIFFSDYIIVSLFNFNLPFIKKLAVQFMNINAEEDQINLFNVQFLLRVAFTIWLLINYKNLQQKNSYFYILLKVQILSILLYVMFSSVNVIAFRVSEFFGIVSIVLFPLIVYTFRSRVIGYTIMVIYSLAFLMQNLHYSQLLDPYRFVFQPR